VDLSEARVTRLWSRVSERLDSPRRGWRWLWAPALASALGVALLFAHYRSTEPKHDASAWQGTRLETAADSLAVTLIDGSKLKLDPNSRVEMGAETPSAVRLVLERGRVDCDVTHREGRSFMVVASGVEVRVIGTHFSVTTEHNDETIRVEVRVDRGVVEVQSAGHPEEATRVEAGRSWSRVTKTSALPKPEASSEGPATIGAPASSAQPPAPSDAPAPEASAASNDSATPRSGNPSPSATRPSDARELLEQASGLWREGRVREAAQSYQTLLSTYPRDPRAGLAAFELGRLRMDRLGDLAGAVRALERAVALAPGSSFREDALARLVTAYAGVHNRAGCERTRDQYLREFPAGVRRRSVAAACGAP
jgi:TolA-binding protein